MMIRMAFVLTVSGFAFAAASAWAQESPAASPPAETAPAEVVPAEAAPAESKPAESRPVESKPAESKPAESKPAESKSAETSPADAADSRYTFSRVQDGYVRLDNRTGQVSFCSKRTVGWGCQLVPEDRIAFESEIARLQDENATLKKDLLTRGLSLPGGVKSEPPLAQGDPTFKLPNDANVERMKSYITKLWRRLVDMIAGMQKDVLRKS
jgi:hypothetical protein